MKKALMIAAGLLLAGGALAHDNKSADAQKTTSAGKNLTEVTGDLQSSDRTANSLTLSLPSGDTQVLKIAKDAEITRDGSKIGLEQLKPGDSVRASFDPKTNEASKIDVTSKTKAKAK